MEFIKKNQPMKTQPKNLTRQNQHCHGLFLDLAYADRLTYLCFRLRDST